MTDSVYKVVTWVGTSTESWEKAAKAAVDAASHSLRELRIAEVIKQDMVITDGKVESNMRATSNPPTLSAHAAPGSARSTADFKTVRHPRLLWVRSGHRPRPCECQLWASGRHSFGSFGCIAGANASARAITCTHTTRSPARVIALGQINTI